MIIPSGAGTTLIRSDKFACFNSKHFYLGTPPNRFEYVHVRFNEIPQELINE